MGIPDRETDNDGKAYTEADARTRDAKRALKTIVEWGTRWRSYLSMSVFMAQQCLQGGSGILLEIKLAVPSARTKCCKIGDSRCEPQFQLMIDIYPG